MKLEDQFCTLKQSKRLLELGINERPVFWWVDDENSHYQQKIIMYNDLGHYKTKYPAYTSYDLGEMLPLIIINNNEFYCFNCSKVTKGNGWEVFYSYNDNILSEKYMRFNSATESQARAKMLIYLLENNILTISEIENERNFDIIKI